MSGVISGGWGFVAAAYSATGLVLAGYVASVLLRYRAERRRAARERAPSR